MHLLRRPLLLLTLATASGLPVPGPASCLSARAAPELPVSEPDPAAQGTQILLVTGIDHPGHPWQLTAPVLKGILEADSRLTVCVATNPETLGSPHLAEWDVIILHFMDWDVPGPGPAARANLRRAVAAGTGLVLNHFACGAWDGDEWPGFVRLAGRVWDPGRRGHDPRGPFQVEITDHRHPITRGLPPFDTVDELYTCLTGDTRIHVLAKARSKVDGEYYPMAFVLEYGQGRVFHTVLGHDVEAYATSPTFAEMLRRACAWTARLTPVPGR